jgi:hypothetical protein
MGSSFPYCILLDWEVFVLAIELVEFFQSKVRQGN